MLPKNARLTVSADFTRATKSGTRVTTENFVGYLYISPVTNHDLPKCGLIINKSVGGSVTRHALARKVRHAISPQLSKLPTGSLLVIRALAKNNIDSVGTEIEKLISKLLDRASRIAVK
ncbi:MAG: ribonuclease P protein component [Actinobacteria bacterium]|nr:ribonuclease P protein component [Actinomycetota bacterium]